MNTISPAAPKGQTDAFGVFDLPGAYDVIDIDWFADDGDDLAATIRKGGLL